MIERYIEITYDACGEIEWSGANETLREFKAALIRGWKLRGQKALCPKCIENRVKWTEAVLHEGLKGEARG